MSTKISELPLDTDYILDDYVPIVDSAGMITKRVKMLTLVTGTFGLSASFITLRGGSSATEGFIRLPYTNTGGTEAIIGRKNSVGDDQVVLGCFANTLYYGNTNSDAYFQGYDLTVNLTRDFVLNLAGDPRMTANTSGIKFPAPVTASVGVSGSHGSFGTGYVASTGFLRGPNNDGIYFRNAANNADIAAVHVNSSNLVTFGNGAFGGGAQLYAEGITVDSRAVATNIQTSDTVNIVDRNTGFSKFTVNMANDTMTFAHSGTTTMAYDGYLQAVEARATMLTTPGSPSKAMFHFISGANGKTYGVDIIVTAQSTTTTGSLFAKYTGHYYRTGGVIGVVDAPYAILESANHAHLTASLTSSAGNIVVSGTQGASAESFRWGCFIRVQEQGA